MHKRPGLRLKFNLAFLSPRSLERLGFRGIPLAMFTHLIDCRSGKTLHQIELADREAFKPRGLAAGVAEQPRATSLNR